MAICYGAQIKKVRCELKIGRQVTVSNLPYSVIIPVFRYSPEIMQAVFLGGRLENFALGQERNGALIIKSEVGING